MVQHYFGSIVLAASFDATYTKFGVNKVHDKCKLNIIQFSLSKLFFISFSNSFLTPPPSLPPTPTLKQTFFLRYIIWCCLEIGGFVYFLEVLLLAIGKQNVPDHRDVSVRNDNFWMAQFKTIAYIIIITWSKIFWKKSKFLTPPFPKSKKNFFSFSRSKVCVGGGR